MGGMDADDGARGEDGMVPPSSEPLAGRLLVATPGVLEDDTFGRTVVLVIEHSTSGALGVVLNRPTGFPVEEPFPGWDAVCADPPALFLGGPVQQSMIIALGRLREGADPDTGFQQVMELTQDGGRLGTVDLTQSAWDLGTAFEALRVFAGYAGWSSGQLEGEIEAGAWLVVDVDPWDAFVDHPDELWARVLRRQGGHLAMFANYPANVMAN